MTFWNCASPATMLASRRNARLVPTADGVKIAETAQSGGKRDGPRNEARMAQAAQRGTRRHSHHAARIGKRSEVKEWDFTIGNRKALVSQLSRVRLRSPIYKV